MNGTPGNNEIQWRGEFPKSLNHFILEHADEGIWWLDRNSLISAVNPMGAAIVGCSPEEMIGHSPIEFLTFSGAPLAGGKFVEKNGAHTMHRVQRKDGSFSIVVSRTVPLTGPEGTYNGAIIYIIDISEANQWIRSEKTEEQLEQVRAERQLLIAIITRMPDPVFLIDRLGTILFANDAASVMTGKEPRELTGKRIQQAGFPCPLTDETASELLSAFESGISLREVVECPDFTGTMVQSYSMTPVPGPDGDCSLALMVVRDPVVKDARDRTPESETETCIDGGYQAGEVSQSIQDLYVLFSTFLSQFRDSSLSGAGQEIFSSLTEVRRVLVILEDLLSYVGMEISEEVSEEVSCATILNESEHELAVLINETGTSIVAGTLPTLWTDPVRLRMIFSSLIGNAILSRGDEPLIIRVAAKRIGSSWQFSVKDNGIGVNPLYADRVFEFPDKAVFPDAGSANRIRLAVCKKIIERDGGRIWVDSIPGQGSTFYFIVSLESYPVQRKSVDIARP